MHHFFIEVSETPGLKIFKGLTGKTHQ